MRHLENTWLHYRLLSRERDLCRIQRELPWDPHSLDPVLQAVNQLSMIIEVMRIGHTAQPKAVRDILAAQVDTEFPSQRDELICIASKLEKLTVTAISRSSQLSLAA